MAKKKTSANRTKKYALQFARTQANKARNIAREKRRQEKYKL